MNEPIKDIEWDEDEPFILILPNRRSGRSFHTGNMELPDIFNTLAWYTFETFSSARDYLKSIRNVILEGERKAGKGDEDPPEPELVDMVNMYG